MSRLFPLFVTLAVVALIPSSAPAQDVNAAKDAIKTAFLGAVEVSERGDADAYMRYFTQDAVIMAPGQPAVRGAPAIHPWVKEFFAKVTFKFSEWNSQEILVFGDAAVHRYTGVATLVPREGGQPIRQERQYLDVMRRGQDGKWRISQHIFNLTK